MKEFALCEGARDREKANTAADRRSWFISRQMFVLQQHLSASAQTTAQFFLNKNGHLNIEFY